MTPEQATYSPLIRSNADRSGGNSLDNLRWQPEADVFWHNLEFLHVVVTFGGEELHCFLHQALWRRGASRQRDRFYIGQPIRFDVFVAVDEVRVRPQISRHFHQTIRI